MKRGVSFILLFLLIIVFLSQRSIAQQSWTIIIKEVMPKPSTGNYEWVKIYNNSCQSASIESLLLQAEGSNKIPFALIGTLGPHESFTATKSAGWLKDSGNTVYLYHADDPATRIDSFIYPEATVADQPFVRQEGVNQDQCPSPPSTSQPEPSPPAPTSTPTQEPTATPSATLTPLPNDTPTPSATPSATATPTPTPTAIPNNILLSEIMPKKDNEKEWVELYNNNDFSVTLEDWYIDDVENAGGIPKKFSLSISSYSYAIFEFSSGLLNDSGDSVRLLDLNKKEVDSVEYSNAPQDKSYSRQSFVEEPVWCFTALSKNASNNSCENPTPTPISTSSTSSKPTPTPKPTVTPKPNSIPSTRTSINSTLSKHPRNLAINLAIHLTPAIQPAVLGAKTKNNNNPATIPAFLPTVFFGFTSTLLFTLAFLSFFLYRIYNEDEYIPAFL